MCKPDSLADAFYQLKNELKNLYSIEEAAAIAHQYLESLTGLSKVERLLQKENELNEVQIELFVQAKKRLLQGHSTFISR